MTVDLGLCGRWKTSDPKSLAVNITDQIENIVIDVRQISTGSKKVKIEVTSIPAEKEDTSDSQID